MERYKTPKHLHVVQFRWPKTLHQRVRVIAALEGHRHLREFYSKAAMDKLVELEEKHGIVHSYPETTL